jgi:hypothetical protein
MTSRISKSVLLCVIWATTLSGRAHAQSGSALSATDFTIFFEHYNGSQWVQMTSVEQQYFFNQARCQCDQDPNAEFKIVIQPAAGTGVKIQTALQDSLSGGQGVGRLFAGAAGVDCLAQSNPVYGGSLRSYCTNLLDPGNYPGYSFGMAVFGNVNFWESPPIPVAYLFNSMANPSCGSLGTCDSVSVCSTTAAQTNIQFWAQTNSGLGPDFDPGPSASVVLVGQVPLVPTNVAAEGSNEALNVTWTWPSGVNIATDTTILGVQLFCQRGADQVFQLGSFGAAYQTPATLCPMNAAALPTDNVPFSNLDPKYLCSGLIPAVSTSYRIVGVQNGIPYGVGVAAVDRYGNIGAISDIVYATPSAGAGGAGGTPGSGGAGGSPADGGAGSSDAGTAAMLAGGCSIDVRREHARSETAGILWLAAAALAFALRSLGKNRPHP